MTKQHYLDGSRGPAKSTFSLETTEGGFFVLETAGKFEYRRGPFKTHSEALKKMHEYSTGIEEAKPHDYWLSELP